MKQRVVGLFAVLMIAAGCPATPDNDGGTGGNEGGGTGGGIIPTGGGGGSTGGGTGGSSGGGTGGSSGGGTGGSEGGGAGGSSGGGTGGSEGGGAGGSSGGGTGGSEGGGAGGSSGGGAGGSSGGGAGGGTGGSAGGGAGGGTGGGAPSVPTDAWTRQFGSYGPVEGSKVAVDSAGNVYLVGSTVGDRESASTFGEWLLFGGSQGVGPGDAFVAKYNSSGVQQWLTKFGTFGDDSARAVAIDANGVVYVAGYTTDAFPGYTNPEDADGVYTADAFIARFDSTSGAQIGTVVQFGTESSDDIAQTIATEQVSGDVNIYVGGFSESSFVAPPGPGYITGWVRKFDDNLEGQGDAEIAANAFTVVVAVAANNGHVVATGYTNGAFPGFTNQGNPANGSSNMADVFVQKLNFFGGAAPWTHQFGSSFVSGATTYALMDRGTAVAVASDGTTYVGGFTYGPIDGNINNWLGDLDAFVRRYNGSTGAVEATTAYNPPVTTLDGVTSVNSLHILSDGVVATGAVEGTFPGQTALGGTDFYARKVNLTTLAEMSTWQRGTAGADYPGGAAVDSAGSVVLSGVTEGAFAGEEAHGAGEAFVVKYNSGGTFQWADQISAVGNDVAIGSVSDAAGNVYVLTTTDGVLPNTTRIGGRDGFVVKYDNTGTRQWAVPVGSVDDDHFAGIAISGGVLWVAATSEISFDIAPVTVARVWKLSPTNGAVDGGPIQIAGVSNTATSTISWVYAQSIVADGAGGVFVGGWTYSLQNTGAGFDFAAINFDPPYQPAPVGSLRGFVGRINGDGFPVGGRNIDAPEATAAEFVNELASNGSDLYVFGQTSGGTLAGSTPGGYFIRKYTSSFEQTGAWTIQDNPTTYNINDIAVGADGSLYASGAILISGADATADLDGYVRKYNAANGAQVWQTAFGATAPGSTDVSTYLSVSSSGLIYAAGVTNGALGGTNAGENDVFVKLIDGDGNAWWTYQTGSTSFEIPSGSFVFDGTSGAYLLGATIGEMAAPGDTHTGGEQDVFLKRVNF